ncbi:hypothetical protein NDU88_006484 [Pleurodeles waltl]|uniref:Uncharacterized protein n=1 Tax=Pleurodeles waltl TaxID=8319 RepID=A0AAV7WCQ2_PLEWA|nr:hypothetical protein NDU88_006484 [Pleurodeles waltl]
MVSVVPVAVVVGPVLSCVCWLTSGPWLLGLVGVSSQSLFATPTRKLRVRFLHGRKKRPRKHLTRYLRCDSVYGLTDKKAIAILSILEVLFNRAVAEYEGIMYTPRILGQDVSKQSLVVNYGLHIDRVGVLSVPEQMLCCCRWYNPDMGAVNCTKHMREAMDLIKPLFDLLLLLLGIVEADVAGVREMMASKTLGRKAEN